MLVCIVYKNNDFPAIKATVYILEEYWYENSKW